MCAVAHITQAPSPKNLGVKVELRDMSGQLHRKYKVLNEIEFHTPLDGAFRLQGARIVRSGTFAKVRGRKALTRSCLSNSLEQDRGRWRPGLPGLKVSSFVASSGQKPKVKRINFQERNISYCAQTNLKDCL